MANDWPFNVTHTVELGSQRGSPYGQKYKSYSDVLNAFLALGWRILNTYVEDKGPESTREECVCLMGWPGNGEPRFPDGYGG